MKVGVCLPQFVEDPRTPIDAAVEAESLGYASVSVFDHLQPLGGPPTRPILEAFTLLTAVAAATERVRLLPLVARAGLRPPATTAHMAATLDRLAGGRFVLGLGAGDAQSANEDVSIGLPDLAQDERRAQVVATIDAVREIAPAVPVWVGGNSRATRALAGTVADGWNVWDAVPEQVVAGVAEVRAAAELAGRRPPYVSWAGPVRDGEVAGLADRLRALAGAGVEEVLLAFPGPGGADRRREVAATVLPTL